MNDKETARKISLLERELSVLAEDADRNKLDLRGELDALHIEIETLKMFLSRHHSDFAASFGRIKSQTLFEKNPERLSDRS